MRLAALLLVLLSGAAPAPAQAPASSAPAPAGSQVVVALDNSGSMRANDPQGLVRSAVADLLARLDPSTVAGLVTFDEHARVVAPLRPMADPAARAEVVRAVQAVAFDGKRTNIPEGVERALYELKQAGPASRKLVVIVTDGIIDTGSAAGDQEKTRWLRESLLPDCRASGVRILGVAFTEGADYALLQEMAQGTDGSYYRALAQADVPGIFGELQQVLAAPTPAPVAPAVKVERVEVPVPVPQPRTPRGLLATVIVALVLLGLALVALWWRSTRAPADDVPAPEIVLHDLATGEQHRFRKRSIRVGRREENDLMVPKPTVSGHHARLDARGGTFAVQDLRSTNGTFVNDARVEHEVVLRNGDVLRFDRYKFAFEVPGEMDAEATSMGFAGEGTMVSAGTLGGGTAEQAAAPRRRETVQQAADRTGGTAEQAAPSSRPRGTVEQAAAERTFATAEQAAPAGRGTRATVAQVAEERQDAGTLPPEEAGGPATVRELDRSRPGTVGTCPDHPSMFATEKCGKCGKRACYSCIRVVEGRRRCQACA